MRDNEQIIFELKRHPIGILLIYVMTGIVLLVTAIAVFGLAPSFVSNSSGKDQILNFTYIGFAVFALLCLLFAWVSTVVYWGNRWILSDDSITQTTQTGLFRKENSQLGLQSLEDVTAEQNGILCKILNYGVLKAETAGHRSKFVFAYCPNPTKYAQQILEAREQEDNERAQYGINEDNPPAPSAQPAAQAPPTTYTPPTDPTQRPPAGPSGSGFNSNY